MVVRYNFGIFLQYSFSTLNGKMDVWCEVTR